jgi:succinate dehydrogenase hydrophobic anchor subunit
MKNKFSWRAFISFGLIYSFIFIFISGILLYVAPPGRYAHWVNWTLFGFTKEGWQSVHTVFSFAFVILSVFHLFTANWKIFLSYLKTKTSTKLNRKREFYFSTLFAIVFFFGIIFSIPPFSSVMYIGEYLTGSWEKTEEEPPVPHAEQLTLAELAEQLKLSSVNNITRKLEIYKIKYDDTDIQSLKDIAKKNETTPINIYNKITRKTENERQGSGIGRKTIEDFAVEIGKTPQKVMEILKKKGIKVEKGETLRDIGKNNDMPPRDIYKLISN